MIKRKSSKISLIGLVPEMRRVLIIVGQIWKAHNKVAVITAGTEAFNGLMLIHSDGSFHPFGRALDFRTNHFTIPRVIPVVGVNRIPYTAKIDRELILKIADQLRKELGKDYDVIVHSTHLHIEYDKK